MRVAVWNIGWNRTASQRPQMYSLLRDEIGADVALVQEAVPPTGIPNVWRPIDGRRWGSAVIGFTVPVEEVLEAKGRANRRPEHLHKTWPGSIAVARVPSRRGPLTLISFYGVIDNGYADTTVNRQLSDLTPLFDDRSSPKIIIGGDMNITTQWTGTQVRLREWEAATFARIRGFGLVDCLDLHRRSGPLEGCGCRDGENCRHIQTQRHSSSSRPWENDYLFASRTLTAKNVLTQALVYDSEYIRELRDHMPLVADFDV